MCDFVSCPVYIFNSSWPLASPQFFNPGNKLVSVHICSCPRQPCTKKELMRQSHSPRSWAGWERTLEGTYAQNSDPECWGGQRNESVQAQACSPAYIIGCSPIRQRSAWWWWWQGWVFMGKNQGKSQQGRYHVRSLLQTTQPQWRGRWNIL